MKKCIRNRYPLHWNLLSLDLRINRAKNRCEKCGLSHGAIYFKGKSSGIIELGFSELEQIQQYMDVNKVNERDAIRNLGLKKISLSVAHLDHDESNNELSNLLVMCQRCHFAHDKQDNLHRRKFAFAGSLMRGKLARIKPGLSPGL